MKKKIVLMFIGGIGVTVLVFLSLTALRIRAGVVPRFLLSDFEEGGIYVDSGQMLTSFSGNFSNDVELGDIDGDGDLDAVVSQEGFPSDQANVVWVNEGSGFFIEGQSVGFNGLGVALGDLDGDRDLDLFFSNDGANKVWINNGSGSFTDNDQSLGIARSNAVALGDLDKDGDLDAVVANDFQGTDTIWWNNGIGFFTLGPVLSTLTHDVTLGDLDGDDDLDIVLAEASVGKNQIWWNEWSDGEKFILGPMLDVEIVTQGVTLAYLDADGNLDVAFATSGEKAIWWNNGDRTFSPGPALGSENDTDVAIGDIDLDGDLDVFVTRMVLGRNANGVWLNNGDRTFSDSGEEIGSGTSLSVELADFDGDGDLDAFVANSGPSKVWERFAGSAFNLDLYRDVRDEVMIHTIEGQRLNNLANLHKPEIMGLMISPFREEFRELGKLALVLNEQSLQALVDGEGDNVVVNQGQVDAVDDFLWALTAVGSSELKQTIAEERQKLPPFDDFVGRTVSEATEMVIGPVSISPDHQLYLPIIKKDF